jgi:hypothetical protein
MFAGEAAFFRHRRAERPIHLLSSRYTTLTQIALAKIGI